MNQTSQTELTPDERPLVAAMWAYRAVAEKRARARFARLAARLKDVRAPAAVVELAWRAVDDEFRHQRLCAELAYRFGYQQTGEVLTGDATQVAQIGDVERPRPLRVLHECVAFCCLTESINATLLHRSLALATEPSTRTAVREILRDEVQHARIGWGYLASVKTSLGPPTNWGAELSRLLPRMLAATVPTELRTPVAHERSSAALVAHGVLPRNELWSLLEDAMHQVVFAGLEHFGVDVGPGRAWLAQAADELADARGALAGQSV